MRLIEGIRTLTNRDSPPSDISMSVGRLSVRKIYHATPCWQGVLIRLFVAEYRVLLKHFFTINQRSVSVLLVSRGRLATAMVTATVEEAVEA